MQRKSPNVMKRRGRIQTTEGLAYQEVQPSIYVRQHQEQSKKTIVLQLNATKNKPASRLALALANGELQASYSQLDA